MQLDETRHEEIKRLMASIPRNQSAISKLPCYMIPFPRNPGFFARDVELEFCRNELPVTASGQTTKCLSLHGVGGAGKTSIALEFAYQEKAKRSVVIWIAADDGTKMSERFVDVARELDIHQDNANAAGDRDAVKEWLERTSKSQYKTRKWQC
jgi:hypothetical protein